MTNDLTTRNAQPSRRALLSSAAGVAASAGLTAVGGSLVLASPAGATTGAKATTSTEPRASEKPIRTAAPLPFLWPLRPKGGDNRLWAPLYMAYPASLTLDVATALQHARDFDIIACHSNTYRGLLDQMKSVNPALKVAVYVNGPFSPRTDLPIRWYLRDINHKRVRALGTTKPYLLDIGLPEVNSYISTLAAERMTAAGLDAVFIDVLGPAPLSKTFVMSPPVNPRKGLVWNRQDWLAATTALATAANLAAAPNPVLGNGLSQGLAYFDPTGPTKQIYRSGETLMMAEGWLRGPQQPATSYRPTSSWQADVDMLVHAESKSHGVAAVCKLWAPATPEQQDQWRVFAVASFLLGAGRRCRLSFSTSPAAVAATPAPDLVPLLGSPAATGYSIDAAGVYVRVFSTGVVMANPKGLAVSTVSPKPVKDPVTGATTTSVVLAPWSGAVLKRA